MAVTPVTPATPASPASPATPVRPRLVVDWTRCQARGLCAELLPEAVALDEWGYPVVDDLPPDLVRRAARARDACPAVALRLTRGR